MKLGLMLLPRKEPIFYFLRGIQVRPRACDTTTIILYTPKQHG